MTDEDRKLIYEFCGWRDTPGLGLISLEGEDYAPPLDLNFYFEYAVPKALDFIMTEMFENMSMAKTRETLFRLWLKYWDGDPAEAFGQALLKLIKGEMKDGDAVINYCPLCGWKISYSGVVPTPEHPLDGKDNYCIWCMQEFKLCLKWDRIK